MLQLGHAIYVYNKVAKKKNMFITKRVGLYENLRR